jgi:hypothetical protein
VRTFFRKNDSSAACSRSANLPPPSTMWPAPGPPRDAELIERAATARTAASDVRLSMVVVVVEKRRNSQTIAADDRRVDVSAAPCCFVACSRGSLQAARHGGLDRPGTPARSASMREALTFHREDEIQCKTATYARR